jgi:integrase
MNDQRVSEKIVAELPTPASGNKLHYFSGATLQGKKAPSGFAVRVTAAGTKSFVWFHRVEGRPHLETIGRWDENGKGGSLSVLDAIVAAKARADAIREEGADPRPSRTRTIENGNLPDGQTVADLLDDYVARYVEKDAKLRSADTIKRTFERLVKPAIGKVGIYDVRRSHVVTMLDNIADKSGLVMADRTLAYLRKAFNWRATRDDEFQPPIAKGMSRTKPKELASDRILADDEIRDLWIALGEIEGPACYPAYVRFLLHTAARRSEASAMRWAELAGELWTVPAERYKTKQKHTVPLSKPARLVIGKAPANTAAFVFSTDGGKTAFSGYSKAKSLLDAKIAELRKKAGRGPIEPWTLHDLRRTARSLMSRAGVSADHAERAIGHVIAGVRGVYDRHDYLDEKREAFEALARQIDRILHPTDNVTQLPKRRKSGG